jgi:hypothetical protein
MASYGLCLLPSLIAGIGIDTKIRLPTAGAVALSIPAVRRASKLLDVFAQHLFNGA